ncbi:MAG: hypothetical protein JST51_01585 [Armatimonadetes bacterium]|nr:hypothetical protein [Armatimonadota bacterium]
MKPATLPGCRAPGRPRKLTSDQEKEVARCYFFSQMTTDEIALNFGIARWWVRVVAERFRDERADEIQAMQNEAKNV